jgi:hypothetical protein
MKRPIATTLIAFAVASTLGACVSPRSALSTATPSHTIGAAAGYLPVMSNGQEFFCREEMQTATRMQRNVCLTPAQLKAAQESPHSSAPSGIVAVNVLSMSSGLR